jgi:hypothetical protein
MRSNELGVERQGGWIRPLNRQESVSMLQIGRTASQDRQPFRSGAFQKVGERRLAPAQTSRNA